jgi:hypothetical protein
MILDHFASSWTTKGYRYPPVGLEKRAYSPVNLGYPRCFSWAYLGLSRSVYLDTMLTTHLKKLPKSNLETGTHYNGSFAVGIIIIKRQRPFETVFIYVPTTMCGPDFGDLLQSRSQMYVPLAPQTTAPLETAEPNYFSRVQTRGFVYTLRMNILTCAQLKLDDSAEFQIVPTISNQISHIYCTA